MGAKQLLHPSGRLHDEDFVLWTTETARLLREGHFAEIDVERLAEEIEDMGNRDRREVLSRLTLIIQHLLKWQFQLDKRSASWKATIAIQRGEIEDVFQQSASLKRASGRMIARAYERAVRAAAAETDLAEDSFPQVCPYTLDEVLNPGFLPGP